MSLLLAVLGYLAACVLLIGYWKSNNPDEP